MFLIMSSFTSSFTSRKMFLRMLDFDPTHLRDKDQVGGGEREAFFNSFVGNLTLLSSRALK